MEALTALIDLARAEQRLEEVPSLALKILVDMFQPSIAAFYVHSATAPQFNLKATYPQDYWANKEDSDQFSDWDEDRGAIGYALTRNRPTYLDRLQEAQLAHHYEPLDPQVRAELVIPVPAHDALRIREFAVAVVVLSYFRKRAYAPADDWLASAAQVTLSTIYNRSVARERRERRLEFLRGITDFQVEHADLLFRRFLESVSKLVPSRFLSFWLYDKYNDLLVLRSFFPEKLSNEVITLDSLDKPVMDSSSCPSGRSVSAKRPVLIRNVKLEPHFSNPLFAERHKLEWFLSCPVTNPDDEVVGVINIWPQGDHKYYDEATGDAIADFIRPAGATIRLAELLMSESLLGRLGDMQDLLIGFVDRQEDWDSLARLIRELMQCEGCSIFLAEEGLLRLQGTTGLERSLDYKEIFYAPGEGLTGTAFERDFPLPYYAELPERYTKQHISKYRERTSGKSKSILFGQMKAKDNSPIGIIRCTNKAQGAGRGIGRFTRPDIILLEQISSMVSRLHSRTAAIRAESEERRQRLNSLHHEILAPVESFEIHTEWLEKHFNASQESGSLDLRLVGLKLSDMRQNARLVDVLVTSMGRYDEELSLAEDEVSLYRLAEVCKGFLIHEARRFGMAVEIDYLGLPRILADEMHLMRVIYNLLRNSLKYRDPEGKTKKIEIAGTRHEHEVELSVKDWGIGVVEGEEGHIFSKFARGSNAAAMFPEGTGLGLHYSRVVIEAHGGRIWVAGREKPTVFSFVLPLRRPRK